MYFSGLVIGPDISEARNRSNGKGPDVVVGSKKRFVDVASTVPEG
jgi:2-keto-3-deoxy-galactonokinase